MADGVEEDGLEDSSAGFVAENMPRVEREEEGKTYSVARVIAPQDDGKSLVPRGKRRHFSDVKPLLPGGFLAFTLAVPCVAVEFEKDVLPILESNCFKCHKDGKEKGDLNLQPHKIKKFIGSGRAIIPGQPSKGLLMKMIQSDDPDNRMPPKGSRLSGKEVQTLKLWISQGAELGRLDPEQPEAPGAPAPIAGLWTNKAGKEIKATLMKVDGDRAVLRMANGKVYKYPIANLSAESQAKVKEFAEKAE